MFPFVFGIKRRTAFPPGYYVDSVSGDDSNDGTAPNRAWATLAKVAATTFSSGDAIYLVAGSTWNETLTLTAARHNGIRLLVYGTGNATIHGQDTRLYCIDASLCDGLTIGATDTTEPTGKLVLQDPTSAGLYFAGGTHTVNWVTADGSGDQNFQNIHDTIATYNYCTVTGAADDGFSAHNTANVTINSCTITGNNQGINTTVSACVVTVNNCIFANTTNDILPHTTTTCVVNRSIITAGSAGGAKSLQGPLTLNYCIIDFRNSAQTNTQIASPGAVTLNNCTVYGWSGSNTRGGVAVDPSTTITARNCIFDRAWRVAYVFSGGAFNATNCNFNGLTIKNVTSNTAEVVGNPLLTDPANDDFSLSAGSPAIGAGTTYAGQLATDYAGNAVASPPSIGALEYVS